MSCRNSHSSMKMTMAHTLIEICAMFCNTHGKRYFTHICQPHKSLICELCLEFSHQQCNVHPVNSIKESNVIIKSIDFEQIKSCMNQTTSNSIVLGFMNSVPVQTFERSGKQYDGNTYFLNCINAILILQKDIFQERIRFSTNTVETRVRPAQKRGFHFINSI